jgi:hypothetical protein
VIVLPVTNNPQIQELAAFFDIIDAGFFEVIASDRTFYFGWYIEQGFLLST